MIIKQANTEFKKMSKSLSISICMGLALGAVIAVLAKTFRLA